MKNDNYKIIQLMIYVPSKKNIPKDKKTETVKVSV